MRRFRPGVWLAWLLLTALLVGCGQKGPLYLPDDEQTVKERSKDRFEL